MTNHLLKFLLTDISHNYIVLLCYSKIVAQDAWLNVKGICSIRLSRSEKSPNMLYFFFRICRSMFILGMFSLKWFVRLSWFLLHWFKFFETQYQWSWPTLLYGKQISKNVQFCLKWTKKKRNKRLHIKIVFLLPPFTLLVCFGRHIIYACELEKLVFNVRGSIPIGGVLEMGFKIFC